MSGSGGDLARFEQSKICFTRERDEEGIVVRFSLSMLGIWISALGQEDAPGALLVDGGVL